MRWLQTRKNSSYFSLSKKENNELSIAINGDVIKRTDIVKFLGVTIDSKLKFNVHVKIICQKTNDEVETLSRVVRCFQEG